MASCMCCSAFRPRYKRLVDNIYPDTASGGLVRSEMEKLTYYAVSAPEKLDRIGNYLAHKLTRDIHRHKDYAVFVAMEALNQLLQACHSQQINLFVESFLKMVSELLESENLKFQALGTNSFVKFCKIEEDTASYHRRYDFFVSKFSAMCFHEEKGPRKLTSQMHGVKGIQGVIRKTVSDELQVNIWQKQHMDKIMPSLLYVIMTDKPEQDSEDSDSAENPAKLAEQCIQELLSRATFSNCGSALKPALAFLDSQNLWNPDSSFAVKIFKIFMCSVQGQYSHVVIKSILDHLDKQPANNVSDKASMLEILCVIVKIPSSSPIGPAVIEVFNQLVQNVENSVNQSTNQDEFHDAYLNSIGTLAEVLPEYQKLEAMVYFVNKIKNTIHEYHHSDTPLKMPVGVTKTLQLLFKSTLSIAKEYHDSNICSISSSLLDPLLKVSLSVTHENRLLAQKVLVQLLDRKNNLSKVQVVSTPSDVEKIKFSMAEPNRHDVDFIDRKLPQILHWLYDVLCLPDSECEHFLMTYKIVCVICYGVQSTSVIVDLCRVMLVLQEMAITGQTAINVQGTSEMDAQHRTVLLSLVYGSMSIISEASKVTFFIDYVSSVLSQVKHDDKLWKIFNPMKNFTLNKIDNFAPFPSKIPDHMLFNKVKIQESFTGDSSYDRNRLQQPFVPNFPVDGTSMDVSRSMVDAESVRIEFANTPEQKRTERSVMSAQSITYEYLKKKMNEPPPTAEELQEERIKIAEHVKNSTFEQLVAEMQANVPENPLNKIIANFDKKAMEKELSFIKFTPPDETGFSTMVFPSVCVI